MSRTLAIGDIHGSSGCLDALLSFVQPTPDDTLIFLGDYVDRGPDSRGVIDRLIWLTQNFDTICLRGNHELMMTRSRKDKSERKMWLSVGGTQALASYALGGRATLESVPEEHWEFMTKTCVDYYETDRHIFVHAGLHPDLLMVEQPEEHLFWEFLEHPINHLTGKIVVCGHTSQRSGIPLAWPKTWCIDTYAYATGWLTCLDVNTQLFWQANSLGQTRRGELEFEE